MGNSLVLNGCTSNSLKLFKNKGFKVRVIIHENEPWFVAKDVASCIEYDKSSLNKMCKLCREKDVDIVNGKEYSDELSEYSEGRGNPNIAVISESGLYRILAKCNLPKCEPFESWVFDEVLPSIRKTGSYGVNQLSIKQQNILKLFDNKTSDADKAIALKEIVDEEISTANKRAFTSMGRLGGVTTALNAAKEALNTANETIKSITSEFNGLKESIGQSEEWQSSAQLMNNYPEVFGTFKSTNSLTRYLKKRNVLHKLSDHPDSSGYLFTIFKVEEAMNVVKL